MEFHITLSVPIADLGAIEEAIGAIDPAVMVDIDPAGPTLRIAAAIDAAGLIAVLDHAGYPVALHQVTRIPSICCGGCSG
jgi:hypothetical protein